MWGKLSGAIEPRGTPWLFTWSGSVSFWARQNRQTKATQGKKPVSALQGWTQLLHALLSDLVLLAVAWLEWQKPLGPLIQCRIYCWPSHSCALPCASEKFLFVEHVGNVEHEALVKHGETWWNHVFLCFSCLCHFVSFCVWAWPSELGALGWSGLLFELSAGTVLQPTFFFGITSLHGAFFKIAVF